VGGADRVVESACVDLTKNQRVVGSISWLARPDAVITNTAFRVVDLRHVTGALDAQGFSGIKRSTVGAIGAVARTCAARASRTEIIVLSAHFTDCIRSALAVADSFGITG
jgi:hypothetical protein